MLDAPFECLHDCLLVILEPGALMHFSFPLLLLNDFVRFEILKSLDNDLAIDLCPINGRRLLAFLLGHRDCLIRSHCDILLSSGVLAPLNDHR